MMTTFIFARKTSVELPGQHNNLFKYDGIKEEGKTNSITESHWPFEFSC